MSSSPIVTTCVIASRRVEPSQRLLRACGYSGLAEVEFKYDRATGEFLLIEVNPRHWDQHELGRLVGVNMSRIAYQDAIGCEPAPVHPRYESARRPRWVAEREALFLIARNAARTLATRKEERGAASIASIVRHAFAELYGLFQRPRLFSILSFRDPIPGILFSARIAREVFTMAVARMTKRHV